MRTAITRIISGGQTGVDQATLDIAIRPGIPHGGWISKERPTENGPLPDTYRLIELPTGSYPKRTQQNVIDSDGTRTIARGRPTGGTALTGKFARRRGVARWSRRAAEPAEETDFFCTWKQRTKH